jgi:phosphoribosyl 1,2-cyclic phosphodiesterase
MSLREITFQTLASGSKGNTALLGWTVADTRRHALIDCGLPLSALEPLLAAKGLTPEDLSALLITHEHSDHIGGVAALAGRTGLPVYMTKGAQRALSGLFDRLTLKPLMPHESFDLGGLHVHPYPVPHDARECVGFTFGRADGGPRLGYLTDCGHITPHIVRTLKNCPVLAVESNHCPMMLATGPYPEKLKRRVAGAYGHLSNDQTAGLLAALADGLTHVCLTHLSETNNTPMLALASARAVLPAHVALEAASQHAPAQPLSLRFG